MTPRIWSDEGSLLISMAGAPNILYAELRVRHGMVIFRRYWTGKGEATLMTASQEERQQQGSDVLVLSWRGAMLLVRHLPRLAAAARMAERQHRG